MFRIRTKAENKSVFTLYFNITHEWLTIKRTTVDSKVTTKIFATYDSYEAGQNHLLACQDLKTT